MKAALYARVSTEEQTTANQLGELEQLAKARGWEPVLYEETVSARAAKRPAFDRMMADARAGRVQAIVVWRLDRLHRSLRRMINDVLALEEVGVRVVSVRDSWMDTQGPARSLLLAIFGWVAEMELEINSERTKAGQARARAQGKRIGRPPVSSVLLLGACERVEGGMSVRDACKAMGVKETTLRRTLRARRAKIGGGAGPKPPPSAKSAA